MRDYPEFDFSELRGRIVTVYGTMRKFADALGISANTLSGKMSNKTEWSQPEIYKSCKLLKIEVEKIPTFFFREKG